jgi:hypothetical protein
MDFRICQTSTATPAEPGGLSLTLGLDKIVQSDELPQLVFRDLSQEEIEALQHGHEDDETAKGGQSDEQSTSEYRKVKKFI